MSSNEAYWNYVSAQKAHDQLYNTPKKEEDESKKKEPVKKSPLSEK